MPKRNKVKRRAAIGHKYKKKDPTKDFDVGRDKTGKPLGHSKDGDRGRGQLDIVYEGIGNLGSNNSPQFNTYELGDELLESLKITGPLSSKVFVSNLDCEAVTTQKLEEVFKLAGRVVKIDLKRDKEGNIKGHGTIEMGHPVEAVQAISMLNGQKFYNKILNIRMDKYELEDKHLPEGLQSVGKGLGANGLPLHLSNNTGISNNLAPAGLGVVGGLNAGGLGVMSNQMALCVVGANPTGIPGIGMGIQERNFSTLGTGVGVGGVGQNLSLAATGSAGLGNPTFLPGGTGANAVGGLAGLRCNYYDISYYRGEDGYRNSRTSDTHIVENKIYVSTATETDLKGCDKAVNTEDFAIDELRRLEKKIKKSLNENTILKSKIEECKREANQKLENATWDFERMKEEYEEIKASYSRLAYSTKKILQNYKICQRKLVFSNNKAENLYTKISELKRELDECNKKLLEEKEPLILGTNPNEALEDPKTEDERYKEYWRRLMKEGEERSRLRLQAEAKRGHQCEKCKLRLLTKLSKQIQEECRKRQKLDHQPASSHATSNPDFKVKNFQWKQEKNSQSLHSILK